MKPIRIILASIVTAFALTGAVSAGGRYDSDVVAVQSFELVRDRGGDWRESCYDDDVISERRLVRRLMRRGFVEIQDIDLRRDRYIVRAVRPNGALVRLVVDAYNGEIIDRERIGWVRDSRGPRPVYGHDHRRDRRDDRPRDGIEFDLGGGNSLGFYSN